MQNERLNIVIGLGVIITKDYIYNVIVRLKGRETKTTTQLLRELEGEPITKPKRETYYEFDCETTSRLYGKHIINTSNPLLSFKPRPNHRGKQILKEFYKRKLIQEGNLIRETKFEFIPSLSPECIKNIYEMYMKGEC